MNTRDKLVIAGAFILAFAVVLPSLMHFIIQSSNPAVSLPENDRPRTDKPMGKTTEKFEKNIYQIGSGETGRALTYYWFSPHNAASPLPLVLILHGQDGRANAAEILVNSDNQKKYPAYILAPVLPEADTWALPDNSTAQQRQRLSDVMMLVRELRTEYPVDPAKIFVLGCSEGGTGAYGAAYNYSDDIAAATIINGNWDIEAASDLAQIPLRIEHGVKNDVYSIKKSHALAQAIEDKGGEVTYIKFPDMGHECSVNSLYSDEMWSWLFSQKK